MPFRIARRLLLCAATASVSASGAAQDYDETIPIARVPGNVQAALKARFPKAEPTVAEIVHQDGTQIFGIRFDDAGISTQVKLTPEAVITQVDRTIPPSQLPAAVRESVEAHHPHMTVRKAVDVAKGDLHIFRVSIRTVEKRKVRLTLDALGHVVETREKPKRGSDDAD